MDSSLELIKWYSLHSDGDKMRQEVGNSLWTYLHKLAKWTPPETSRQYDVYDVVRHNVEKFPCEKCASHGVEWMDNNYFDPQEETMQSYLCRFHNAVNEHLHKPIVSCPAIITEVEADQMIKQAIEV